MGVTVIVSSGDDGVSGSNTRGNPGACGFFPQFPASSPHVTTVGATQGPEDDTPEVVCEADAPISTPPWITSGGGFSSIFPQPTWQASAVAAYLTSHVELPPNGSFGSGRAYPDVAVMGHSYPIVLAGQAVSGALRTCASCVLTALSHLRKLWMERPHRRPCLRPWLRI